MQAHRFFQSWSFFLAAVTLAASTAASAQDLVGTVKSVDRDAGTIVVVPRGSDEEVAVFVSDRTVIETGGETASGLMARSPCRRSSGSRSPRRAPRCRSRPRPA